VLIVDSKTGRLERTFKGRDEVVSLAFAPDGTLEVGTWAGIVQRFDASRGLPLGQPTLVTPSPVASLSFDPGGDTFSTTGGSDGTAKLWTTSSVQQLGATFQSDAGHWGTAAFTPNGRYLLVVYDDGTGFLWPTTESAWEDHACAVAGRNFTREEWRRLVAGHSYSKTCPGFPAG